MKVVRGRGEALTEERGPTFTGTVWADPVLPSTDGVVVNTVCFTPGAHTFWHSHERGQLLQVIAGEGWVCSRGEQTVVLRAGDTVWVPPGETHWHGATPGSMMTHTATSLGATEWFEELRADEYRGPDH
ncbi:cupin domain-containing protein [Okibacterium endophyticum]